MKPDYIIPRTADDEIPFPPLRTMKEAGIFSRGLVETDESKQLTREWEIYMNGYRHGRLVEEAKNK